MAQDVAIGDQASRPAVASDRQAVRSYAWAAFGISLLILVLRYPTSLFAAEPLWEDGPIFYLGGFDGLASIVRPCRPYPQGRLSA